MKKKTFLNRLYIFTILSFLIASFIFSCAPTKEVANKGGGQLWSENCGRCHNSPPASTYSAEQWDVIGMHMRMRAKVTADEVRKIIKFLDSAK